MFVPCRCPSETQVGELYDSRSAFLGVPPQCPVIRLPEYRGDHCHIGRHSQVIQLNVQLSDYLSREEIMPHWPAQSGNTAQCPVIRLPEYRGDHCHIGRHSQVIQLNVQLSDYLSIEEIIATLAGTVR